MVRARSPRRSHAAWCHQQPSGLQLRRELARTDQRGGLLADLDSRERLPLAPDVLDPVGEGSLRGAQCRRRKVIGECRTKGQAEERCRVDRGAGRRARADLPGVDATMIRNECAVHDQRVRAGAAHPDGAPVVVDPVIVAGKETPDQRRRLVRSVRGENEAEHCPGAVVGAAREWPAPRYPVAALHAFAGALARGERRRHHHVRIVAPHLLLCFGREQADQPEVARDQPEDPPC